MSLLSVSNLSVHFRSEGRIIEAVRDVSFTIDKGETLALVGESGSGKSVTALSIMQLLPYPTAFHPTGSILFGQTQMMHASQSDLRRIRGNGIGMIFQEPQTSLNPLHTVEKQIGEVLALHSGLRGEKARARTIELLKLVKLDNVTERMGAYPHELSGGQRQRVMIAMALANEPELLIADEPTTALDVTIQAQILELLMELQEELGMAILLITHDLGVVEKVAHRVCVMKDGRLLEHGPVKQVFNDPQDPYTKHLIEAAPHGWADPAPHATETVLSAEQMKVWFPIKGGFLRRVKDYVKAVDDITLEVKAGHTVGIVGESGSGKTTLGLGLLKLIQSRGKIVFDGQDISNFGFKEMRPFRRHMQIVFQDPFGSLSPRLSIQQIVEEGLIIQAAHMNEAQREEKVVETLREVGLEPESRHRYPHEFSGGQRQRVAIARALVLEPKLVVLDEPTSALDMSVQAQIVDLLKRLQQKHDLAYLFISHDLRVVRALSHHVVVMKDGKVMERASAEEIFNNPQTDYTRALIAAAFNLEVRHAEAVGD